jgi:hypothetical protein
MDVYELYFPYILGNVSTNINNPACCYTAQGAQASPTHVWCYWLFCSLV